MIIYHHLGLGDHIICNGLVRHFALQDKVTLLCKQKNFKNVQFMYRDNHNIHIQTVMDDDHANEICNKSNPNDVLRIGFAVGGQKYNDCLWDENFYKNAKIDFEYSWSKFYIEPDLSKSEKLVLALNTKNEPYVFIHNIDSTNTDRIDYSVINPIYKKIVSNNSVDFFDYYSIIGKAVEIHCIDSSFKHLVERIPTIGKLFYHKTSNPKVYDQHTHKKEWYIV